MQATNLLLIMSDEHNSRFMGCTGHPLVKTPNFDRLAAAGTLFDNAYCNCPICVPSRASFATGRYVHDCGYWDNADPYDGAVPSWGHRLIDQGHRVVSVGKLHYRSSDDDNGFDEEIIPLHVVDGVGDLLGQIRDELPVRGAAKRLAADVGRGESSYTRYDREITAAAIDWLQHQAPRHRDRPWVLFVSLVLPHFPLIAPPEFYDLYPPDELPMPALYQAQQRPDHPYYRAMRECIDYDKYFDPQKVREATAAYLGMVSFLDHNVGRLLDCLQRTGLADNTRVLYTSDHGEALGKRGFWGKSTMFEEAVAVPLILRGPGVEAGRRVRSIVSLVDVFPTAIECVGAEPHPDDAALPGASLFGIEDNGGDDNGDGTATARTAFSEYHAAASATGCFMLREGDLKLVYFVGMAPQLFDLAEDPDETTDLAADPDYAEALRRLSARLREICDPEAVDAAARRDQQANIERHGGREAVLARGDFGYSPAPGQRADFAAR